MVRDLLAGNTTNFTNKVDFDKSLVVPGKRLTKPKAVIWFSETVKFTLWEGGIQKELQIIKPRKQ